jgi:hypothetical protein
MTYIVWKAYKTEKAAINYANKIAKEHNVILSVVLAGGVWIVGA